MASDPATVERILGQMAGAGAVSARPMFGEYGVYCDGRFFAVICNDRLYVKPTAGGRVQAADAPLEPPYRGAKPSLLIEPHRLADPAWLAELVAITLAELPVAKPRKRKDAGA